MIYKDRQCEICGERYHHSIGEQVFHYAYDEYLDIFIQVCSDCYKRAAEDKIREMVDYIKPRELKGSEMAKKECKAGLVIKELEKKVVEKVKPAKKTRKKKK